MFKTSNFLRGIAFAALCVSGALSQTSEWKVKPEWVHAHEMFLASDAMRGRGSATPDEWITAEYVASEFEKYGLKPGLPEGTFVQRVELVQPVADGRSMLAAPENAGFVPLQEGTDFSVLRATGQSTSGALRKIGPANVDSPVPPGAVVFLKAEIGSERNKAVRRALVAGAKVILREDASLTPERLRANLESGSPFHPRVAGVEKAAMGANFTLLDVTKEAAERLSKMPDGTTVSLQLQTRDVARYSYNAVGVLPATDSTANAKVILLSAHLDHLGIGQPVNGDSLYNGANDDASGTTAVLELAHALAAGPAPKRTVYFVCYGSEELGGLGSTYFREHSPVPLDRIAANVEFEMIGNQDPKMPKGKLLFTGWNRSNLGATLAQHGALLGDDPYPEQHFFERSDNYSLALKGVVAHTAAGWATPPTYHKPDDDLAHLDFTFLTQAIQSLIEPVRWLANSDFVPQWNPGQQPQQK